MMKPFTLCIFLFLSGIATSLHAQRIDSLLIISPGLSPSVVAHGRFEVALFNQLSTLTFRQEINGSVDTFRFSDLYHVLQVGYGVDKYNRLNLGVSALFAHNRQDGLQDRGPFSVFKGDDDQSQVYRNVATLGVYARAIPIRRLPELTVQAGVFFPTIKDNLAKQVSGFDRTFAQLQVAFYQQLSPLFYAFATAGGNLFFKNDFRRQTTFSVPLGLYPVVRLGHGSKTYLYGSFTYEGSFNKVTPGFLNKTFSRVQYGIGGQYYFTPDASLYLQLQFPAAIDYQSGSIDVLKKNTFSLALGGRCVI
ncbi:MAG: hypothetical protein JNM22_14930 [Saprospiraceae bacterium]|nr:hypothetical protein [Saprospiraceae bacterium]